MTIFRTVLSVAAISVITASTALAGQGVRPIELTPGHGRSFDLGNKRAVSYFLKRDGVCELTLMLSDPYTDDAVPGAATRMRVSVAPGRPAQIDAPNGKSLGFECDEEAASLTVTPMDQVAYAPRN